MTDLIYSFGTLYPGALNLHNYPKLLQHFTRPDGKIMDLAAVDVLRMREFGVPATRCSASCCTCGRFAGSKS